MTATFFLPTKLIFSDDAAQDLVRELGNANRVAVITDQGVVRAGIAEPMMQALRNAGHTLVVYSDVPGNPNVGDVNDALAKITATQPAFIIAIGGGSVIDTAKAVGILLAHPGMNWEDLQWGRASITQTPVPVIAIPTTAGTGSEVSHVAVIGDHTGFKKGVVHSAIFARTAILDGALTRSLPAHLTAATGMDALVHAIEAYLGKRANPTTDLYALGALKFAVRWLPETTKHGDNLDARRKMMMAATWGGIAMDQAGLGLDHALCGPLAAQYHLHHGLGVAVLLPATLAFNANAIPQDRWNELRDAIGAPSLEPGSLGDWAREFIANLGLPTRLREVKVEANSINAMAEEAMRMAMIGNNVRAVTVQDCCQVLESAL
jgi:alcohol dehydrogenase class IV